MQDESSANLVRYSKRGLGDAMQRGVGWTGYDAQAGLGMVICTQYADL